jgi:putative ABC transport system permease protein
MIADKILGLRIGDKLPLGKDVYTVVGITSGMNSTGGDGMAFFSLLDSLAIQFDSPGEAVRLERQARRSRVGRVDFGRIQPALLERVQLPSASLPAIASPAISGVLVQLRPGADRAWVLSTLSGWTDISVYTKDQQKELLLRGVVDRARRQLGLFRILLIIISAIVMALIVYTLTLEKIHDIAMLKLIGARNSVILGLILQQALLLGLLGYVFAFYVGKWVFPYFPRRVVVIQEDLISLLVVVLGISVLSAVLGIWKAMRVEPNEVVS